jgi:hypothetical protein
VPAGRGTDRDSAESCCTPRCACSPAVCLRRCRRRAVCQPGSGPTAIPRNRAAHQCGHHGSDPNPKEKIPVCCEPSRGAPDCEWGVGSAWYAAARQSQATGRSPEAHPSPR